MALLIIHYAIKISLCCWLLYVAGKEISEGLKISVEEIGTYLKLTVFQINEATISKGMKQMN